MLITLYSLAHLIPTTNLENRYFHYSHSTYEKTEVRYMKSFAQREQHMVSNGNKLPWVTLTAMPMS